MCTVQVKKGHLLLTAMILITIKYLGSAQNFFLLLNFLECRIRNMKLQVAGSFNEHRCLQSYDRIDEQVVLSEGIVYEVFSHM